MVARLGRLLVVLLVWGGVGVEPVQVEAQGGTVKIPVKDLVSVQGAAGNHLKGVGIVMGLNGTGDSAKELTTGAAARWLKRIEGIEIKPSQLTTANLALVYVSAYLPPFAQPSTTINVHVSCIGDAKSLRKGELANTPLRSPRAMEARHPETFRVYAIAQGSITLGGDGSHPTAGDILDGGQVTRAVPMNYIQWEADPYEPGRRRRFVMLLVKQPNFNMAKAIADAIRREFLPPERALPFEALTEEELERRRLQAAALDPGRVKVLISERWKHRQMHAIDLALNAEVEAGPAIDPPAQVIIGEQSGTVTIVGKPLIGPGEVVLQGTGRRVTIREAMLVSDFITQFHLPASGGTSRELIEVILAFRKAGALKAEVISR